MSSFHGRVSAIKFTLEFGRRAMWSFCGASCAACDSSRTRSTSRIEEKAPSKILKEITSLSARTEEARCFLIVRMDAPTFFAGRAARFVLKYALCWFSCSMMCVRSSATDEAGFVPITIRGRFRCLGCRGAACAAWELRKYYTAARPSKGGVRKMVVVAVGAGASY